MERSKAESFTAYLEYKQRQDAQRAPRAGGGTSLAILGSLAEARDRRMGLTDLQAASGMSFADFAESIKRLQESGYLTVSGEPGRETAELTRLGADVAELARPLPIR